jgi:tetratricopeptide (TPR) repeat protein
MKRISGNRLRFSAVLVVLVAAAASPCHAEDVVLVLAERLVSAGAYDAAITEYKRFLFFNEGGAESWVVARRIAYCFRNLGRFQEAITWYDRSARQAPDPGSRVQSELDAAAVEIAAHSWSAAEFRILRLRAAARADIPAGSDALLLGFSYLGEGRAGDADRELSSYAASLPDVPREAVEEVLEKWRATPRLRPSTAKLLSTLLPGAGQVYAGHPLDGLNSLVVNAGSAALVAWGLATGGYAEAALAFLYLLQRYYAGSRQNAEMQAIERNELIDRALARELLSALAGYP